MTIHHLGITIPSYLIPVIGQAPAAPEWHGSGLLTNLLAGRGRQLIPSMRPNHTTLLSGNTYTYAVRLIPSFQAVDRLWSFAGRSEDAYDVTIGAASAVPISAHPPFSAIDASSAPAPQTILEQRASQTAADETLDLTLAPAEDLEVDQVSCWEVPRVELATTASELGVDTTLLQSTQPITAGPVENILAASVDRDLGKRVLTHWMVPYELNGGTTTQFAEAFTGSSFSSLWTLPVPALLRYLYPGTDIGQVQARVFAWVDSGTTVGEVRLTGAAHGQTSTVVTTSSTTPVWLDLITDQDIDAEDFTEADGRVSAAWDGVNVEARVQSTGTLYIASAVIWEQLS